MENSPYILGCSLGRWELRVHGCCATCARAGRWAEREQERGKGSISIPSVSCLLREGFSVDGSTLCISSRENSAPAWHWLTLSSFLQFPGAVGALQKCSPSALNHSLMALQAEFSAWTQKEFSLSRVCPLNDLAATCSYFQALHPRNRAPTRGVLTMPITQKSCLAPYDLDLLERLSVSPLSHAPRPW